MTRKRWAWLAALLLVGAPLVYAIIVNLNSGVPRGEVRIKADADVAVYIGDKLVGYGEVEVSWGQLLGGAFREPLATMLPRDTPPPIPPDDKALQSVIDAGIAGPGTVILDRRGGMTGANSSVTPIQFAMMSLLIRRADGRVDQVFVIDVEFSALEGEGRRFLVPVRVRRIDGGGEAYFARLGTVGSSTGGGIIPGSSIGRSVSLMMEAQAAAPPKEHEGEIDRRGLWTPQDR